LLLLHRHGVFDLEREFLQLVCRGQGDLGVLVVKECKKLALLFLELLHSVEMVDLLAGLESDDLLRVVQEEALRPKIHHLLEFELFQLLILLFNGRSPEQLHHVEDVCDLFAVYADEVLYRLGFRYGHG
jgi:hypothetical protein